MVAIPHSALEIIRAMACGLPLRMTDGEWAIVNPPGHSPHVVDCRDVDALLSRNMVLLNGMNADLTDCGREYFAARESELLASSLEWLKSMPDELLDWTETGDSVAQISN